MMALFSLAFCLAGSIGFSKQAKRFAEEEVVPYSC
jgi:hypothetical protein